MTLEERITRLEDIEAIRQLQARYQRCLDTRDFDGVADCFTDDVVSSYGNGSMSYSGRDEVMGFLCGVMGLDMPSTHLIHGGEIDVKGDEAEAKWYLEDYLLHRKYKMKLHGAAVYTVGYRKSEGVWRIFSIGYERCYEYFEFRGLLNQLTLRKMTFFEKVRSRSVDELGKYGRMFRGLKKRKK